MSRRQGIFWCATIPFHHFTPFPQQDTQWMKGQLESGENTGYLHWQLIIGFKKKKSLTAVRRIFGPFHYELSRSEHANNYVWKDETCVDVSTRFEFGERPLSRNSPKDWEKIWDAAREGDFISIPADIRVRSYRTLKSIQCDYTKPEGIIRTTNVFWGRTGLGKSRDAWAQAGFDAYPKDPRTKFWCGYQGQSHVVIDEFYGDINIGHLLRWLDRYPVIVEIKGGSVCLKATTIWITSNVDPRLWYLDAPVETQEALLRRLSITHYDAL